MDDDLKNKMIAIKSFLCLIAYFGIGIFCNECEDIDVTELGKTIMYSMIAVFTFIEVICIIKISRKKEEGGDYFFNYIISIIFLIFAILSIFLGICLRSTEEKMAKDYYNENKVVFEPESSEEFIDYITSNKDSLEKLLTVSTDKEERLLKIYREIEEEPNTFYRYFLVFTTGMSIRPGGGRHRIGKKIYYLIYLILSGISVVQFVYYSSNSNRNKKWFSN